MSLQHRVRLLLTGGPDRDARVRAGGHHPPVAEEANRVHRARMKPQHLFRGFACERPSDGGGVEPARQEALPIGRNSNGHVPARRVPPSAHALSAPRGGARR